MKTLRRLLFMGIGLCIFLAAAILALSAFDLQSPIAIGLDLFAALLLFGLGLEVLGWR